VISNAASPSIQANTRLPTRPRVLVNMAPSLDGKITPAHKHAPFTMSRHGEDSRRMRLLRARADAVIIGAGNLRADDSDLAPGRIRVVVTRTGEGIQPGARMFDPKLGGEAIVAHAATMPEAKRAALRARATLVELGASEVDCGRMLDWLLKERRCTVVLSEGGGVLNAALFAARAVDELYLTVVPRILGGVGAPTIVEGDGFQQDELPDARLTQFEAVGDELYLGYSFDWR
jgi:2,5-diamino-6-(ribosylamino)-4(3H)-pyrimidinone 5'-phosphate reductase